MTTGDAAVDHLMMIATDELAEGRREFAASGLVFAAGGRHPGGTVNALAVHPDVHAYLELISTEPGADSELAAAVGRGGLVAWAVGVHDIDEAVRALSVAGLQCSPVTHGERRGADGGRVHWRTATIGAGFSQSELPFLIEWPARDGHRTGLVADDGAPTLVGLRIGSDDPQRLLILGEALGLDVDGDVLVTITHEAPGLRSAMLRRPDGTAIELVATTREDGPTVSLSPVPLSPPSPPVSAT